jgi:hypothetical protein
VTGNWGIAISKGNPLLAHINYITVHIATELLGQNMKKEIPIGIVGTLGSGRILVPNIWLANR